MLAVSLLLVEPTTHAERFTVPPLAGASESTPVIFKADGGKVVVKGTGTSGEEDAMITLDGCDHVTFDGID
jgi:hypothetical protein